MNLRGKVTLRLEATLSASLEDALSDAIEVSRNLGIPVTLIFNGAHLPVNEGDSVSVLADYYRWAQAVDPKWLR